MPSPSKPKSATARSLSNTDEYQGSGRIPDHHVALDLEASIIAAMIANPTSVDTAMQLLRHDDFYDSNNQRAFAAMEELLSENSGIDMLTVIDRLKRTGEIDRIGGEVGFISRYGIYVSGANVEYHAAIVREKSMLRTIHRTAEGMIQESRRPDCDALQIVSAADDAILGLQIAIGTKEPEEMKKVVTRVMNDIGKPEASGLETGYPDVPVTLKNGHLILIGGRPSQGKTALALDIALHVAQNKEGTKVGFFSLEMKSDELVVRLLSKLSGLSFVDIINGRFSSGDSEGLTKCAAKLHANNRIIIDDSDDQTYGSIEARMRQMMRKHGVKCFIIDYLQLITPPTGKTISTRDQEIGAITKRLKRLAKRYNLPIILLSQLNRLLEARADKRPSLGDLRESGNCEQDADEVLFVHRPEVYGIDTIKVPGTELTEGTVGYAEIITSKHRNGEIRIAPMRFNKELAKFENRAEPWREKQEKGF